MKLTGKCKKDFRKWYESNTSHTPISHPYSTFMGCHDSMKYGVIVDFADSVGAFIEIISDQWEKCIYFGYNINEQIEGSISVSTRSEARIKAIERFNEIYNNKLAS